MWKFISYEFCIIVINYVLCVDSVLSLKSFLLCKHRVPSGQTCRFLFQQIKDFGRAIFAVHHHAEHIFAEPFVGHNQVPLLAVAGSPVVLNFPFQRLVIGVEVKVHVEPVVAVVEAAVAVNLVNLIVRAVGEGLLIYGVFPLELPFPNKAVLKFQCAGVGFAGKQSVDGRAAARH